MTELSKAAVNRAAQAIQQSTVVATAKLTPRECREMARSALKAVNFGGLVDEVVRLKEDLRVVRYVLDEAGLENRVAHIADVVGDLVRQRDEARDDVRWLRQAVSDTGIALLGEMGEFDDQPT